MSWPRGSLFAALLVLSIPLASADTVTVNTTTDDNADNSLCSLREAVEYFNLDRPLAGYQGCKSSAVSSTDTISLPGSTTPYLIGSRVEGATDYGAIFVRRAMAIAGGGQQGDSRTWIQVSGPHRAFIISGERSVAAPACSVSNTCRSGSDAPVLDPASDTGASDYLTTVKTPKFSGTVIIPPGTTALRVSLYGRSVGADPEADPLSLGSVLVDVAGNGDWSITSTSSLAEGVHDISYTVRVDDEEEESDESATTRIAVYAADTPDVALSLSGMELQGCGGTDCANIVDTTIAPSTSSNGLVYTYPLTGTAGKGGIVYNTGTLSTTSTNMYGGVAASLGGAIYAADNAVVAIAGSKLSGNKAESGAAIYAEHNSVYIAQSLLVGNTPGTAAGAAVVNVASADIADIASSASVISNSTFSGNQGLALSLHEGAIINASTIVLNGGGLYFNGEKIGIYNTILAANPDKFPDPATATDCQNLPAIADIDFQFSLGIVGGGCQTAPSGITLLANNDASLPEQKLMASSDASGKCIGYSIQSGEAAAFSEMGLLCPLATRSTDEVTATHLPRLLGGYVSVADSPIVGKGSNLSSSNAVCEAADQRSRARRMICDIGAVEIQPVLAPVVSGDAISYGQTYSEAMDSQLGDEQLFTPTAVAGAGSCPTFALTQNDDRLKPGCPWITIAPSKGTVVFNADGSYTYRPSSNYHGFDRFSFRVVTNLSKLNSTFDSQSRVVNAQIIVEPTNGISAYSTAGSVDLWLLLSLAGLGAAGLRTGRRRQ
ncbi:MAG: CSLREA domain-containing protein [Moraxellaceae bacterium]